MKKHKTYEEIRELHRFAWETRMTPQNADDILAARKALAEIKAEDTLENQEVVSGNRGGRMGRKARQIYEGAKRVFGGGKSVARDIQAAMDSSDYETLCEARVQAAAHQKRRDGRRKKGAVNSDRQARFAKGAVNFADRVANRVFRKEFRGKREAQKLAIRAKRVS